MKHKDVNVLDRIRDGDDELLVAVEKKKVEVSQVGPMVERRSRRCMGHKLQWLLLMRPWD